MFPLLQGNCQENLIVIIRFAKWIQARGGRLGRSELVEVGFSLLSSAEAG